MGRLIWAIQELTFLAVAGRFGVVAAFFGRAAAGAFLAGFAAALGFAPAALGFLAALGLEGAGGGAAFCTGRMLHMSAAQTCRITDLLARVGTAFGRQLDLARGTYAVI